MGSVLRDLHWDKTKKILGPKCHKCGTIMRLTSEQMYGDEYTCDKCKEKFKEDTLP